MKHIVLATRGSLLALKQADIVKELLNERGIAVDILETTTKGDKDRIHALVRMGGNGVFIREIEEKLLSGEADIAVHSGKDLPYELREGLVIAGVPKAADPRDMLITLKGHELTPESVIGTGSPRRMSEYTALIGKACFKNIRGNVTTRLRKLREGEFDGIILAKAGLDRIGADLSDMDVRLFDSEDFIPSPCQGIIAIECREGDRELRKILEDISDEISKKRFFAERRLFTLLKADCTTPIGIHSEINGDELSLYAMLDGRRASASGSYKELDSLCLELKSRLISGSVVLVGGGCGPGLISLRGVEELKRADAIVYDDLIDESLLSYAKDEAELIYVGKRLGRHSMTQEEINDLLIELASSGKYTARLKGGDSFVFGRGGEEIIALKEAGISYAVVPGISSAIAVPEHLGIPVTHRGIARSFTVVTGHTKDDTEEDWGALASLSGTLVFLMGLSRLRHISESLMSHGRSGDTPVSILSRGFSRDEKRIDGRLSDICDITEREKPEAPAIIVVGDTAGLDLRDTLPRSPLNGIRIRVTGSERFIHNFSEELMRRGGTPIACPTIRIRPMPEQIPEDLSGYSWLVFTSRNGVDVFFSWLRNNRRDIRELSGLKLACVGSGTGDELRLHGIYADFIPAEYTAKRLGRELPSVLKPSDRVLILRAEEGSKELDKGLSEAGISYEVRSIYRTVSIADDYKDYLRVRASFKDRKADYIVFASASGVRSYLEAALSDAKGLMKNEDEGREQSYAQVLSYEIPVCIGEATSEELKKYGVEAFLTAKDHTSAGIIRTIEEDLVRRANGIFSDDGGYRE
ncbi:MAG TPA: hydroxymethylbilane synthase [Candidatus Avilachnospira avistercoris]|nr:hydroxymethylbilane synthase [Candidatus Avilachnospira avistercoris]